MPFIEWIDETAAEAKSPRLPKVFRKAARPQKSRRDHQVLQSPARVHAQVMEFSWKLIRDGHRPERVKEMIATLVGAEGPLPLLHALPCVFSFRSGRRKRHRRRTRPPRRHRRRADLRRRKGALTLFLQRDSRTSPIATRGPTCKRFAMRASASRRSLKPSTSPPCSRSSTASRTDSASRTRSTTS